MEHHAAVSSPAREANRNKVLDQISLGLVPSKVRLRCNNSPATALRVPVVRVSDTGWATTPPYQPEPPALYGPRGDQTRRRPLPAAPEPWQNALVKRVNRDKLRLLIGAAGLVLGEAHPATQALARAITTWGADDVKRARAQVRQLDAHLRALLDDLARRAGPRA